MHPQAAYDSTDPRDIPWTVDGYLKTLRYYAKLCFSEPDEWEAIAAGWDIPIDHEQCEDGEINPYWQILLPLLQRVYRKHPNHVPLSRFLRFMAIQDFFENHENELTRTGLLLPAEFTSQFDVSRDLLHALCTTAMTAHFDDDGYVTHFSLDVQHVLGRVQADQEIRQAVQRVQQTWNRD